MEISVIEMFGEIITKLNKLSDRIDNLEKKIEVSNNYKIKSQKEINSPSALGKTQNIKEEIERIRQEHLAKIPNLPIGIGHSINQSIKKINEEVRKSVEGMNEENE